MSETAGVAHKATLPRSLRLAGTLQGLHLHNPALPPLAPANRPSPCIVSNMGQEHESEGDRRVLTVMDD